MSGQEQKRFSSFGLVNQDITKNAESLNTEICPMEYELSITPNLESDFYLGDVIIQLVVKEPTVDIRLHCYKVEIINVVISTIVKITCGEEEKININIDNTFVDERNELFIIYPHQKLIPASYTLHIAFKNVFGRSNVGLYLDTYEDNYGEIQKYIATHFHPTYARRAFPCFDDPTFLSSFQINIVLPKDSDMVALSNLGIEKELNSYPGEELTTVYFSKTPTIPVSKVFFALGKFASESSIKTAGGLSVSVYVRKDWLERTKHFIVLAKELIESAERLFHSKLAVPRIDFIGLPRSLVTSMGFGNLIAIDENNLTIEEFTSWHFIKVVATVAREIAQLWISNYLNLQVWKENWLNDGLAGYLGYLIGGIHFNNINHGSRQWVLLATTMFPVMKQDGFTDTYRVRRNFVHTVSIHDIFKYVSYKKSVSIFNMIFRFNGKEFMKIISNYFLTNDEIDFKSFCETSKNELPFNPQGILKTFITQKGYPVLNIRCLYCNFHIIERESFSNSAFNPRDPRESNYGYKWDIPIYYICETDPSYVRFLLMRRDQKRALIECPSDKWILLNYRHAGYYRVNYSTETWTKFTFLLMRSPTTLTTDDRGGLIDDAFNLALAGYFEYNIPLNLTTYLHFQNEAHCFPWHVISRHLRELYFHFMNTQSAVSFMLYVRSLLEGSFDEKTTWNINKNDSLMLNLTKLEILDLGGWAGHPKVLLPAANYFLSWLDNKENFNQDLLHIILKYGMHNEFDNTLWKRVLSLYKETPNSVLKDNYWLALASINKPEFIEILLQEVPLENLFRPEILQKRFSSLCNNNYAIAPLWNFIRKNSKIFFAQKIITKNVFKSYIVKAVSYFDDPDRMKEVTIYFKYLPTSSAFKRAVENVQININWKKLHLDITSEWLHLYVTNVCDKPHHKSPRKNNISQK